jgi:glycerate dehydrogenase
MKLVILDGYTTNPGDLSWDSFREEGKLAVYDRSSREEAIQRMSDADAVWVNGVALDRKMIQKAKNLKYIGILCTGYNHVDLESAQEQQIAVTNVPCYAEDAVAQHTIALLLELTNQVGFHNMRVQQGAWSENPDDCFWERPLSLLNGKTMGIVGYGAIGKNVARVAEAFGMKVVRYRENPEATIGADVVSLHCPLGEDNQKMIDAEFLSKMKKDAFLINTARGGLIDEDALAEALKSGRIRGAAIDVLTVEPPKKEGNNPLMGLPNCIITPHHAWVPLETREKLIAEALENWKAYLRGQERNRLV